MLYTYHGCHGNIFPQFFLWKMKIFLINCPFFLLLFLKQELNKIIRNVHKIFTHIIMVAMATYFFQKFCEKFKFFKSSPFFLLLFLKQELKKLSGMLKKTLYTHYHGCYGNIFLWKIIFFQIKPILFYYYF